MEIGKITGLKGTITIPGDKSVSHRAIMLGSIAQGTTEIHNFLRGADCLSTIQCFRSMGIEIKENQDIVTVHGKGLHGLTAPSDILDVGNSGTTTRLLSGILAGQEFDSKMSGDSSLNTRPMRRIIEPLTQMGANISSIMRNGCAPLYISKGNLHGIHYHSKVASAQVKSAILLAGLYADSETAVTEPTLSRNHTELMLKEYGADVSASFKLGSTVATASVKPCTELFGQNITVPGDISSAAYFIAAGLLVPDSEIVIKNVGINSTRSGILKVCENMGANISLLHETRAGGEPVADILVRTSQLHGTTVEGPIIPTLIDEIPIIAVMAAMAEGTTVIRDAAELKVKETNRIETVCDNLASMGCDITPTDDGMIIHGGNPLHSANIHTLLDHRIAMAFTIAGLVADGITNILDSKCIDVSYPTFYDTFEDLL
ncbi:3-phosphoshikimate 1-carboxyvinyltransferase [Hespellia stercorisuis]|uniref:3-phosphoshikimate 1-carboxyvinyltransferase n=1 Tax=Hespellia stercorisuis DSM 15480 TaxID=1121950 RepID=A0A1M6Q6R4_9FIRM|nr:3-phosphoshikimate 1-carboxyvinyltransferase [Hespellia stercorisuis]SHK15984.1 3-phosphoshikimate 1-carboxyvinyltransferase [Hespellia stercorisuis DSM 15480]